MAQHVHPVSQIPLGGMRLGLGATLRGTDQYASSDGNWRPAASWAGCSLQSGCPTVWVRPGVELSPEGRALLGYLVQWNFYLTQRGNMWIVVPSAKWKYDGRIPWEVQHPECIEELRDYGFIARSPIGISPDELGFGCSWPRPDDEIYQLAELGRGASA